MSAQNTFARIRAIRYHLPEPVLDNPALGAVFPDWGADKILEKTGISERHIAGEGECASDLGVRAAARLFEEAGIDPGSIDYLLFCTQSPDHFLPTTACIMQDRLGLRTGVGALDFNLGCSGFIYGLGLAKGLIETGQASRVLLITAETYSKHIHPEDRSVRTLFGDAAAATLLEAAEAPGPLLGPFLYGTDGRGAKHLIVPTGGFREPRTAQSALPATDEFGNTRSPDNLFMDGPEIFKFTLEAIPALVRDTLAKAGLELDDLDHYVFHQANAYMLNFLRKKIKIPAGKFPQEFAFCGNTVSSTIPIVLAEMVRKGTLLPGQKVMLVGFGVGYSWGAALCEWR